MYLCVCMHIGVVLCDGTHVCILWGQCHHNEHAGNAIITNLPAGPFVATALVPWDHSSLLPCRFVMSRISCKWNHTICNLLWRAFPHKWLGISSLFLSVAACCPMAWMYHSLPIGLVKESGFVFPSFHLLEIKLLGTLC